MTRQPMVLTGPQAVAFGILAGLAWAYRATLRHVGHVIRCGPALLLDDEDFDEYIAEQHQRLTDLAEGTSP